MDRKSNSPASRKAGVTISVVTVFSYLGEAAGTEIGRLFDDPKAQKLAQKLGKTIGKAIGIALPFVTHFETKPKNYFRRAEHKLPCGNVKIDEYL